MGSVTDRGHLDSSSVSETRLQDEQRETNQGSQSGLHRSLKYRPDVDGLRAIAVTSVVVYHCGLGWIKGGFVGVDIFFVISGYLIGALVHKEIRAHNFSIARFYERRAKRILPALFGILLFSYIIALLILSPLELRDFAKGAFATITSSSNIVFWLKSSYFSPNADQNPLLMTWSLGVEEQFYIFFPLLMLLIRKLPQRAQFATISVLTALSLAVSIIGTAKDPTATFYLLPTRAWELAAGVLLALFEANRPAAASALPPAARHGISLVGLALLGIAIFSLNSETPFPGYAALLPVAGAVMIIFARHGVVNRLLSWRPIVFIGLVSYSWYLWHWPLLSFAHISSDKGLSSATSIAIGALSFLLAVLSWRFIEQPFRKSTTPTTTLLTRYAMAIVVVALPLLLMFFTHGLPQRNRAVAQMESAGEPLRHDACLADYGVSHPNYKAPCVPAGDGPAVALIGDSHASALAPGLRAVADREGYRMLELDKMSCPALDGVSRSTARRPRHVQDCSEFNQQRIAYVLQNPNIRSVVIEGYWSDALDNLSGDRYVQDGHDVQDVSLTQSPVLLQQGLDRLVDTLEKAGKQVYLVQDNPAFGFDPMRHMRTAMIAPRHALAGLVAPATLRWPDGIAPPEQSSAVTEARARVVAVAAAHPGTHIIDLQNALCSETGCRFAQGNQIVFADYHHLSPLGARMVFEGFELH